MKIDHFKKYKSKKLAVFLQFAFCNLLWAAVPAAAGDHDYFNSLVSRADYWKSYSFRNADYVNEPWVSYDPGSDTDPHRQDATKVIVPAFRDQTTLATDIGLADTTFLLDEFHTAWQVMPHDGKARFAQIEGELMMVVGSSRTAKTITVARGQLGTVAVAHSRGAIVRMNVNSLPGQSRVPIYPTEDGNTYLFTWDGYWTDSYLHPGITNHKCFQFSSDDNAIWFEVDTRFGDVADPATQVARVGTRSYNQLGGDANWMLTDGNYLGPSVTDNADIEPMIGEFFIKPNTWTRFWIRIEQRANDYDYMDFWVADQNNNAVRLYDQIPLSIRQTGRRPNTIEQFWLEFNTSTDYFFRTDLRDLVAYVRNFVALKNPPNDLSSLFQRPVPPGPMPPPVPSAPRIITQPQNRNILVGESATFSITATGSSPITYQWLRKGPADASFNTISGATSRIYVFSNAQLIHNGTQFQCRVTNGLGSVTTSAATLGVVVSGAPPAPPPPPPPPPSGTTPPPPPPPPTSGLTTPTLSLPDYLPINSQITAGYTGSVTPAYFSWTFTPDGRPTFDVRRRTSDVGRAFGASAASFNTPTPTASLATAGLDLGSYLVTVTAHDSSGGASASASANVTLVSANLDQVRVYPNPWRSDRHTTRSITFDNLTVNTEIKIFTTSGHHVKTLPTSSSTVDWDLKNESGDKVASGIYMYVLKADDGSKKTGKVVVIK